MKILTASGFLFYYSNMKCMLLNVTIADFVRPLVSCLEAKNDKLYNF